MYRTKQLCAIRYDLFVKKIRTRYECVFIMPIIMGDSSSKTKHTRCYKRRLNTMDTMQMADKCSVSVFVQYFLLGPVFQILP